MLTEKIQPVVIAVIRKQGKYLLTLRAEKDPEDEFNNIWQLPGGGLEFGEKLEECVKREAMEELGIEIEPILMMPKIYEAIRKSTNWHGLLICFLCRMKNESDEVKINYEASDYKWCTVEEVKKLSSFSETAEILQRAEKLI